MRIKYILSLLLTLVFLGGFVSFIQARPDHSFKLPLSATEVSDGVYSLGVRSDGLEGRAYVYRKGEARTSARTPKAPKCYGFLASGARWKNTEPYVTDIVSTANESSLETWDSQVAFDIFGTQDAGASVDGADTSAPDDKNELYYGEISDPGVIGVTIVWGYFGGPPQNRRLIEWDMVLDNADFSWGDTTLDSTVMDYQNILTHELGHAAGLNDQYSSYCTEATMYGYATEGETKKRDLAPADVTGVRELYR